MVSGTARRASTDSTIHAAAGNGESSTTAARYLAVRKDVNLKLKEYRRVLAETEVRRERAVRTLQRAGYLRD